MTYSPTIYDWRSSLVPLDQTFRAGGQMLDGGLTVVGAMVGNPEPGGRAELMQEFATFTSEQQNRDASWTISRMLNQTVFRVPIFWYSVQLVPPEDIGGSSGDDGGILWGNGETWSSGSGWEYSPVVSVSAAASEGSETVTVDMSAYGEVLHIGHVIGFKVGVYDFAHTVMDVTYDASDVATVTVSPPLRRDLTTSDEMKFRPSVLVTCTNAREVAGMFMRGRHMAFNRANWVEALV